MTAASPVSVDEVLAALAEPMRRQVLDRIAVHGETTATVLTTELPVTRQAIVQHLAVLDQVGLVTSVRVGRERRYRVRPEPLRAAAEWMSQAAAAWDTRLTTLQHLAAEPPPGQSDPEPRQDSS
jgi:DNA-binding transcriptional ArsR family regulator